MNRNRNQRRNVNQRTHVKTKFKTGSSFWGRLHFVGILPAEGQHFWNHTKEHPVYAFGSVLALLANIFGVHDFYSKHIAGESQYTSSGSSSYPHDQSGIIDGLLGFFPGRIMVFLILTLSLGWTISLVGIWLTKTTTDTRMIIAHAITAFGAIFMVLYIDVIFASDITRAPLFVFLIAIIGVTLAVFIAKTNFQQSYESRLEVTASRTALLMNFSTVTAALVVFSQVTGLSQ